MFKSAATGEGNQIVCVFEQMCVCVCNRIYLFKNGNKHVPVQDYKQCMSRGSSM